MASQEMTLGQFGTWVGGLGRSIENLNFTKPLQSCAVAASGAIKEAFATSTSPDGMPWLGLAFPRPSGPGKPLRDTGLLMASATAQGATGHIREITANSLTMGSNLDRAALHQFGGTIRPKQAKMLTIPLTREAARSGGARNMAGLFFMKSKSGKAFLAESKTKGKGKNAKATLIFHWLLVDSATIPARPFIGISEKLAMTWEDILAAFVKKELG